MELQETYTKTIAPQLMTKLSIKNPMAAPKLVKLVINMGVKDAISDKKQIERMSQALMQIAGQKPKVARAKKSIATFKLREGDPIGLVITMRGKRMYAFVDKLIRIVFPRMRDFHGIKKSSFDGHGNYALGLTEYSVFPEIDLSTVEKAQGMEIIMVTTAKNDEEGLALLEALGMPFEKEGGRRVR